MEETVPVPNLPRAHRELHPYLARDLEQALKEQP